MAKKNIQDFPKHLQGFLKKTSVFDKNGKMKSFGEISANILDGIGWDEGLQTTQPGEKRINLEIGFFKNSNPQLEDDEDHPSESFGQIETTLYVDPNRPETSMGMEANEYQKLKKDHPGPFCQPKHIFENGNMTNQNDFYEKVKEIGGNVVSSYESSMQAIPQIRNGKTNYIYVFKCSGDIFYYPLFSPSEPGIPLDYRIYMLRRDAGWTQSMLAEALGVSQPRIAQLENGEVEHIKKGFARKLAKIFRLEENAFYPYVKRR